jgi:sphingolipid delta-4 desaturase
LDGHLIGDAPLPERAGSAYDSRVAETPTAHPRHELGIDRFIRRKGEHPHLQRARAILRSHPELKDIVGPNRWTILVCLAAAGSQVVLAKVLAGTPWWAILLVAYTVGACISHLCWALIHEATHKLLGRSKWVNHLMGLTANLPLLIPSYAGFRKYHILHHRYMGDYRGDADVPSVVEARFVGRSPFRKALWLLVYPMTQLVRTRRLKRYPLWDRLVVFNLFATIAMDAALLWFTGPWGMLYLGLSLFFSVGLHPVGARWIQEHYVFREGQETYSCYSKANPVQLNIGMHVEHHDIPSVPWNRLPIIRRTAHEFYDDLKFHRSWTGLFFTFLFSPRVTLFTRYVRDETNAGRLADATLHSPSAAAE